MTGAYTKSAFAGVVIIFNIYAQIHDVCNPPWRMNMNIFGKKS